MSRAARSITYGCSIGLVILTFCVIAILFAVDATEDPDSKVIPTCAEHSGVQKTLMSSVRGEVETFLCNDGTVVKP